MRWPTVFAALAAPAGCGDGAATGPVDGLPMTDLTGEPFDAPTSIDDIARAGESRWVFH